MLFEEKLWFRDKNDQHFYLAWLMLWVCFLCNGKCNGQEQEFTTFCNPINIDYQFNIDTTRFTGRNLWREAADPVIVTYNSLNSGVDYYFKVDSFNDSGISYAPSTKQAPARRRDQQ